MFEMLALELDSIKSPGCTRTKGGRREEALPRDHRATDSIWSKLPPLGYLCQWARRPSRVKLAVILWRSIYGYIPGTRYLKWLDTRYQVPKINIWYRGINLFFFFGGFGLVGLCFFFSVFGETKYCTPYIVILWVTAVVRFIYFLGDIDPEAWVTVLIVGICWWLHSVWQATVDLQRYSF